jgi:hypothetical protein
METKHIPLFDDLLQNCYPESIPVGSTPDRKSESNLNCGVFHTVAGDDCEYLLFDPRPFGPTISPAARRKP